MQRLITDFHLFGHYKYYNTNGGAESTGKRCKERPFLLKESRFFTTEIFARGVTIKWFRARIDDPEAIYEGLRKAGLPEE